MVAAEGESTLSSPSVRNHQDDRRTRRAIDLLVRAVRDARRKSHYSLEPIAQAARLGGSFDAVTVTRLAEGDLVPLASAQTVGHPPASASVSATWRGLGSRSVLIEPRSSRGPGHVLAPITVDGAEWGFVIARESLRGATNQDALRLLEFCAALAGGLASQDLLDERKSVIADQNWMLQGQRELIRVAESMLVSVDPSELLQEIVDRLGSVVDVDTIDLALHYPDEHVLRTIAAKGIHADILAETPELPDDQGIMGWVFQNGTAELINNPNEDIRLVSWRKFGRTEGALIAVPLLERSRIAGVLVLMRLRSNDPFTGHEFQLVKNFADLASIALRNAAIQNAAETRARTDPLTGLRNRDALERTLVRWIEGEKAFSLMVIDLDHFKTVNDSYGHLAGDQLLVAIAAVIKREARGGDMAFRLGGDEFLLVLPSTAAKGALAAGARLVKAVKAGAADALAALGIAPELPVSCSVGVACYPLHGTTPKDLLAIADRAAYDAKSAGRDQAKLATAIP